MKSVNLYLVLLIFNLFFIGCKKDDVKTGPVIPDPPGPPPAAYKTKSIQIELPSEVKIDPSTLSVHSLSVNTAVTSAGKSDVAFNKAYPHIAWVFDKESRLLLAGFMSDSSTKINTRTTAQVLLYFGYATMLEQYSLTAEFLNNIDKQKNVTSWYSEFDELFKKDPLVMDKGIFREPLKLSIQKISNGRKVPEGKTPSLIAKSDQKKITDITILNNSVKSGIRPHSNELSKISIDNDYRRRAHAFLYKIKSTGDRGVVNSPLISSTVTLDENIIDPVGGFTSVSGVLGAWIENKELEFFSVTAGPVTLNLNDDEDQAEYKLRVVGPGMIGTNNTISNQEAAKLTQLEIETLALDFLLPVMLEVVGNKDDLALIDGSRHVSGPIEDFLERTTALMKIMPGVYDEVRKGSYPMALQKFIEGLYSEGHAAAFESMVKLTASILEMIAQQRYYVPPGADVFKDAERKMKILKLIDVGLFANDIARMGTHIGLSNQVEEWTVLARSPRVTLLPGKAEVVPLQQQKITCEIKNMVETGNDTHPFFEWRTSGKWGKLTDTKGHTNQISFGSSDHEVFYYSNAKLEDLKDENNYDTIYVVAKFGSDIIGRDTMVINVKKETNTFTLALKENLSIVERWSEIMNRKEWTCSNPYFTAEFPHRAGAKTYSIRIVRKDGTKAAPTLYYPQDFVKNGIFYYRLGIGSIYIAIVASEAQMLEQKARQEKMLAEAVHSAIEVTVNY